jgi:hypothetical protein
MEPTQNELILKLCRTEAEIYDKLHRIPSYAILITGKSINPDIVAWASDYASRSSNTCRGVILDEHTHTLNKDGTEVHLVLWEFYLRYRLTSGLGDGMSEISISLEPEHKDSSVWEVVKY